MTIAPPPPIPTSSITGIEVAVLGPLQVTSTGTPVHIGPPKARAVLSLLALHAGRTVPVTVLTEALWDEDPPRSAAKALQLYVSFIRRTLPMGAIVTVPGGYLLRMAADDVDAARFALLRQQALEWLDEGRPDAALGALREALAMWNGSALPDLAEHPKGQAEIARLEELRRSAEEALGEAQLRLGRHAFAVADLEAAVAAEPLRERRWAQLITALYRAGRQADALRAYERLRVILAEQLGIEPSAPLQALEAAVLAQRVDLDLPGGAPRFPDPVAAGRGPLSRGCGRSRAYGRGGCARR
jgi:DNA-binding SARP family transcriptional activator